jgi:nicotinamidase/pyrazinamidase
MSALIIVDPNNDFVLPKGALSVPGAEEAIPMINLLRANNEWDVVVVTSDWHPENHCSFHVNNPGSTLFEEFTRPNGEKQIAWPVHCVAGTPGANFVNGLKRSNSDWHVYKGQDPEVEQYSAFEGVTSLPPEMSHIVGTDLATLLSKQGIRHVVICGFATDYCVYNTALDAQKAGFDTDVFLAACRGVKKETTDAAIADMKAHGIIVSESVKPQVEMVLWPYVVGPLLVSLAGLAVAWCYKK